MKVLITGKGSYVGLHVAARLEVEGVEVVQLDMTDASWREHDFSSYDSVFHVAGIAHVGNKVSEKEYFAVNRDLAVETAEKAKAAGVKQFVFMSSILVYERSGKNIGPDTSVKPRSAYGKSKAAADEAIRALASETFKVAVLRPPMIFGEGCKGNFPRLVSLAMKAPFFPKKKNARSMIYIGNFAEFAAGVIVRGESGVFFPQNPEYFSSALLARDIAAAKGKKLRLSHIFDPAVWLLYPFSRSIRKVFGSLTIDRSLSGDTAEYCRYDNAESIRRSVAEEEK